MTRTTQTAKITLGGVLGLSVLVLALSGCAGSQPSQVPQSGGSATSPAAPSEKPLAKHDVEAISIKFMPMTITVKAGTTVRWVNGEKITHTITSGAWTGVNADTGLRTTQTPDGLFNFTLNPRGQKGDSFEYTYDKPGTYPYYCDIHLGMNAVIIVQ